MQNTVQVPRNAGTKPASVQTKTGRRKPAKNPPVAEANWEVIPDTIDYFNGVEGGTWFALGMSKAETKMVKAIAGNVFTKKAKPGIVARMLLQAALAHYDVLRPLMIQDELYAKAEGFNDSDCYLQGAVQTQWKELIGQSEVAS